jgi:hypothetical protein
VVDNNTTPEPVGGFFREKIYSTDRIEIGVLNGGCQSLPEEDGGFIQEWWKTRCLESPDKLMGEVSEGF